MKQKITFWILIIVLIISKTSGEVGKRHVREIVPNKQKFMRLRPCRFYSEWEADDPNLLRYGFYVEDVNEVYPDLVERVYMLIPESDANNIPSWDWVPVSYDSSGLFAIAIAEMKRSREETGLIPTNIGSMLVGGNTAKTIIDTQNTYVDLNLAGLAVEASDIELWSLIDTVTGELKYEGFVLANLRCTGLIAAYSAGGTQRFNFRLLKNDFPLSPPDNVNIPLEIRTTIHSSSLWWNIIAEPNDTFRLQVENADGVSDITIDTLKVIID